MNDIALVKLDSAQHALAECKTAMEAKQIADVAEAARVYLERTNASVETVNRATEIRALAERQMGTFLKTMPKATGTRNQLAGKTPDGKPASGGTSAEPPEPTLAEIGITKKQSATAQKLADIPEPEFKERIAVIKAGGEKLSTAKVLEFEKPRPRRERYTIPDRGMFIARGAVNQLETILPDDGERLQALRYVRAWCDKQIRQLEQ